MEEMLWGNWLLGKKDNTDVFFNMLQNDTKKAPYPGALRAIDGARTRGLDLGKVARYQLRHYRLWSAALATVLIYYSDIDLSNVFLNYMKIKKYM